MATDSSAAGACKGHSERYTCSLQRWQWAINRKHAQESRVVIEVVHVNIPCWLMVRVVGERG